MAATQAISNSELTNIVADMIRKASAQPGVTAVAAGGSVSTGLSADVRLGEVDKIEFNRDKSLGITVYKDKCKGSVSISDLSSEAIDSAVQAACRIASYTEADPYSGLADKNLLAKNIQDLKLYYPAAITAEQAIAYAKECEAGALGFDKKINNTDGAAFSYSEYFYVYGNSDGFLAGYPASRYNAYCTAIAEANGNKQRDYDFTTARDINDLNAMVDVGRKAAQKTIARLNARKIKTCQAPVLFVPTLAKSLWSTMISAISGGNLYRKSSFLLDKIDHKIFPDFVTITEEPQIIKGLGSAPFDDEGVATTDKVIIGAGTLNTYLLGSYSARRLDLQTTGNSGGVHNIKVVPGMHDYEQLMQQMGTGLVVTELLGQGTNMVTGDYSHGAVGFWVENGVIQYPVEEITIAGNLVTMFKNLVAIGNDVDSRSNIMTGSILIDSMTIAGA